MASPRKTGEPAKKRIGEWRIGESQNHVHDKGGANFSSLAGRRPGMNSGADRPSSLKRAPKQRASARWARVEPVSRHSLCSWAMAHRVTVQPLTKKRKISWRSLKIENQLLPPIPWPPSPALRGGKGKLFFVGFCRRATPACKNPIFFLPLPNGACAVGEGAGGGAKATAHKGSSIAG